MKDAFPELVLLVVTEPVALLEELSGTSIQTARMDEVYAGIVEPESNPDAAATAPAGGADS